jgi:hypothetical protein
VHADASGADRIAAAATHAAIAADALGKGLAELVIPEALHSLARAGAGVVAAGFLLEAGFCAA